MLTSIEIYVIDSVKKISTEKNISQEDLASLIDVSIGFIGKVESFKYGTKYNLNHINKIAKALEISPRDLLPEKYI